MAISTKRIFKKSMSWAGLFFFALACYMIYRQLHNYEFGQITQALADIPVGNLLLACAASFFGYVALSLYDWLSLKYIGKNYRHGNGFWPALSVFPSAIMPDMPLFRVAHFGIGCIHGGACGPMKS